MRLLLVDDDPKFRATIARGLSESDIECQTAANTDEALAALPEDGESALDLILLDVMMPGRTGWECLEEIRARGIETPVIFLTARGEVAERVRGLRLGADDYIIKPFDFEELLARIEAVVRRREAMPTLIAGDLKVDLGRRHVERAGKRIEATPREFELLRVLLEAHGKPLTKAELLHEVWNIEFDPGTNVVEVLIARLRSKLNRLGPPLIHTVPSSGYRLAPRETEA